MPSPYVSEKVLRAEYAVRGLIPTRATEMQEEIRANPSKYPFKTFIFSNIGNPQALKQKPLSFNRDVIALVDAPHLLENSQIVSQMPADAVERAREMLKEMNGVTGAYTHSQGYAFVRRDVAAFITKRDHLLFPDLPAVNPNDVFLTDGASTGVKVVMTALIGGKSDGCMIPIPQYPLYTASLALLDGTPIEYYLEEGRDWSFTKKELEAAATAKVKESNCKPRLFVVINPGNPTGQVLSQEAIEDVLKFCHDRSMVVLADEVYQENIYSEKRKFYSFRSVLLNLPEPYRSGTMLVSLHSTSKGIIGECGRRGGYMELINVPSLLRSEIVKLSSINLCSNVNGQIMTSLMVRSPKPGDASYESYSSEYKGIFDSLVRRAKNLAEQLNKIPGIVSNDVEGAMYAFPAIRLPKKFIEHNDALNAKNGTKIGADVRWCLGLLERSGVVVVPGSGFGQAPGTMHFRTTILPPEDQMAQLTREIRAYQESIAAQFGMPPSSKL